MLLSDWESEHLLDDVEVDEEGDGEGGEEDEEVAAAAASSGGVVGNGRSNRYDDSNVIPVRPNSLRNTPPPRLSAFSSSYNKNANGSLPSSPSSSSAASAAAAAAAAAAAFVSASGFSTGPSTPPPPPPMVFCLVMIDGKVLELRSRSGSKEFLLLKL